MATKHERQESPEHHIFRRYYGRVYHAIKDPRSLADKLFSKGIISSEVKEQMAIMRVSVLKKKIALLDAVELQIQTNSQTLHVFLSVLEEDPSMQYSSMKSLVEDVRSKCSTLRLQYVTR